jgi:hypothetical protein
MKYKSAPIWLCLVYAPQGIYDFEQSFPKLYDLFWFHGWYLILEVVLQSSFVGVLEKNIMGIASGKATMESDYSCLPTILLQPPKRLNLSGI